MAKDRVKPSETGSSPHWLHRLLKRITIPISPLPMFGPRVPVTSWCMALERGIQVVASLVDLHAVVGAARAGRHTAVHRQPAILLVSIHAGEAGRAEVLNVQGGVDPVVVDPDRKAGQVLLPA